MAPQKQKKRWQTPELVLISKDGVYGGHKVTFHERSPTGHGLFFIGTPGGHDVTVAQGTYNQYHS